MSHVPTGRAPTFADVEKLGLHNPIVSGCLSLHKTGDLNTEEALCAMVLMMADMNERVLKELCQAYWTTRTVYLRTQDGRVPEDGSEGKR